MSVISRESGLGGLLLGVVLSLVACDVDRSQVQLCEAAVRAFEQEGADVETVEATPHPNAEHAIMITYQSGEPDERSADDPMATHWISCRFAGGPFTPGRLILTGVTTDREGTLSPIQMAMLRIWLRLSGLRVLDPDGEAAILGGATRLTAGRAPSQPDGS